MKPCRRRRDAVSACLSIFLFVIIISSCKKDKDSGVAEISDLGTANEKVVKLDFQAGTQIVDVITIKNRGSGNMHVKISTDTAVSAPGVIPMPAGKYSISNDEFDLPPNSSQTVQANINRVGLTVDQAYGLNFKIDSVSGGSISGGSQSIKVKFDLRNKWDGRYSVTGTMVDIASPALTGYFPQEVALVTNGRNSVVMIPRDLGIPGFLILSGTSLSYYGSFGPVFYFDEASSKIVSVVNNYGQPASNTRSAEIDPSGTNKFDEATKSITIKFYMKQPNVVTTAPYIRTYFNNTLINLGSRY